MNKLFGSKIGLMLKELEDEKIKYSRQETDHFLVAICWIQSTLNDYKRRVKDENKKLAKCSKGEKN